MPLSASHNASCQIAGNILEPGLAVTMLRPPSPSQDLLAAESRKIQVNDKRIMPCEIQWETFTRSAHTCTTVGLTYSDS